MGIKKKFTGRRWILKSLAAIPAFSVSLFGTARSLLGASVGKPDRRIAPTDPDWPAAEDWKKLSQQVGGRLLRVHSPLKACRVEPASEQCDSTWNRMQNPVYLEDQPGATQTTGWLEGWSVAVSEYAVAVESAQDIAAAVRFAKAHNLRLVVKGTGHDYMGRSNAAGSLLVWTHRMRKVTSHDPFRPLGAPTTVTSVPAVTAEAGTRWLEAYDQVSVQGGRYVQGGGCTSVGVAGGFIQGGGFGSFSRKFGTGAGSMLEAEVVLADGSIVIANDYQNSDLFWALRGGGGGTYGIVSKVTLQTHEIPESFGVITGSIKAASDEAFKELLARFVDFVDQKLLNEHWGEQFGVKPDNSLSILLVFQGITRAESDTLWQPLLEWIGSKPGSYKVEIKTIEMPATRMWDYDYLSQHHPDMVQGDGRAGQPKGQYWWAGNQGEVSQFIYGYYGRYLPARLFDKTSSSKLVDMLFQVSRLTKLGIHINKGLAGASAESVARTSQTSMNPEVLKAAGLLLLSYQKASTFPGIGGHTPDVERGKVEDAKMKSAMKIVRALTPGAGSYTNESSYFDEDWQQDYWGIHYGRLLAIKRKYDPDGLFYGHHCVGSEDWTDNGMKRVSR
ncbi:MAG: FAD-binding oxidoreductase [Planctomycetales bacterium]